MTDNQIFNSWYEGNHPTTFKEDLKSYKDYPQYSLESAKWFFMEGIKECRKITLKELKNESITSN